MQRVAEYLSEYGDGEALSDGKRLRYGAHCVWRAGAAAAASAVLARMRIKRRRVYGNPIQERLLDTFRHAEPSAPYPGVPGLFGDARKKGSPREPAAAQILKKLRSRLDPRNMQLISRPRAGDIEQMPFGVVDIL